MQIDKSSFFILVATIAAGGAGGWFVRDQTRIGRSFDPNPEPVITPAPAASPEAPEPSASVPAKPPPPPCDDSVGKPLECTRIITPADEEICGTVSLAVRRCRQYQAAFQPKVAEAATACLLRLNAAQVCNPTIVNKCGHEALMAACPPGPPPEKEVATKDPLEIACRTILTSCAKAQPGPTLADCRQTLSGMSEAGRTKMIKCMEKHCDAKGLYGCEAL